MLQVHSYKIADRYREYAKVGTFRDSMHICRRRWLQEDGWVLRASVNHTVGYNHTMSICARLA